MPSTVTDRLNGLTTSVAVKPPCVAVASSNLTLSGLQTVGGVALAADDRVLCIAQTSSIDNGIYIADSGTWVRARDFDGARDAVRGTLVLVRNQFVEGAFYELTTANPVVFGTSAIVFRLRDSPAITYQQSQSEITAGVTPVNYGWPEGQLERYGAIGDDATNNATALASAALVAAQGVKLVGTAGKIYRITSGITAGLVFNLDLNGATLKPVGNFRAISHNPTGVIATVITTVSSGATKGSRSVVVASATGLVVGQYCKINCTAVGYQGAGFPPSWATITAITGTTIEFDVPLCEDYVAPNAFHAYTPSVLGDLFKMRGILDLALSTFATNGAGLGLSGYKVVALELDVLNASSADVGYAAVQAFTCLDITLTGRALNNVTAGNVFDFQLSRSIRIPTLGIDGASFGIGINNTDMVSVGTMVIVGRRQLEIAAGTASRSIRGLKLVGCGMSSISTITAVGLSSPLKFECSGMGTIGQIMIMNAAPDSVGDCALNLGSQGSISRLNDWAIGSVVIDTCLGIGLNMSAPSVGRFVISSLIVKNCGSNGVNIEVADVHIGTAIIQNWSLATPGTYYGIRCVTGGGGVFDNITFRHTVATETCMNLPSVGSGLRYAFGNILNPDGNPIFTGDYRFQNSGSASIASGSTSATVTHLIWPPPIASEISIKPTAATTAAPGHLWVTVPTDYAFQLHCAVNPGASGLAFDWYVRKTMPFTA